MLALLMALPVIGSANDKIIVYVDTIVAADTAIEAINVDTLWSEWDRVYGASRLQFFYDIEPTVTHMKLTEDTFYVYWQHSFNLGDTRNVLLGKATDTGATWSAVNLSVADSVVGNWGRFMVIHRDSTDATSPDSLANIRGAKINLWIAKIN